jgi:Carboxypeptidase regulatory-like domain
MLTQLFFRGQVLLVVASVSGTISGKVTDPSGAAIAGTTVEVKNPATQVVRSNAQGRFTAPGFQNTVQTNVPVVIGGGRVVDMTLKIGQAQASQVDTSSSAVSTLVETKQVEDLPLNGRNYTQLVDLAPGFYGTGEDYSVGGARPEGHKIRMSVDAHAGCYRTPQLPSVHVGSDRVSGRDVIGVA